MSEIERLKKRIDDSRMIGVETAQIRDDYEPAGAMMIYNLTESGGYVQRKTAAHSFKAEWRIFKRGYEPY